jgi:hypothetical protein
VGDIEKEVRAEEPGRHDTRHLAKPAISIIYPDRFN